MEDMQAVEGSISVNRVSFTVGGGGPDHWLSCLVLDRGWVMLGSSARRKWSSFRVVLYLDKGLESSRVLKHIKSICALSISNNCVMSSSLARR